MSPSPLRRPTGRRLAGIIVLACQVAAGAAAGQSPAPTILRGAVVTPDSVMRQGFVAIADGRIVSVSESRPELAGAVYVDTEGIILPGFVDIHNHVPWNVFPRWAAGRLFTNRGQWRTDPEYLRAVGTPFVRLRQAHLCDMNAWGELRALVGGTTGTMTTRAMPCIRGMVRNLDFSSGFYGEDRERIVNVLDVPPAAASAARTIFVDSARRLIANPAVEAIVLHLAEGTGGADREEYTFLRDQGLLDSKAVLIHAIPLRGEDFRAMAAAGTALVWSPRSNLELYAATTDVLAAIDAGVEVALAPDWAITGSSNLLDELKVASRWNRDRLGGRLSDRQLVDMATSAAARAVGLDDEFGAIRAGLRADLLVVGGRPEQALRSVVEASPAEVRLVMIAGVAMYGDPRILASFWSPAQLEEVPLAGGAKVLATPAAGIVAALVENRLTRALQAEGITLAPLTDQPRP